MQLEWYGQSAFRLTDGGTTVFIDPFDDLSAIQSRGMRWDYPAIEGVSADLLLVTHEHLDHNGVGAIGGDPVVLRATGGDPRVAGRRGRRHRVRARRGRRAPSAGRTRSSSSPFGGMRVAHLGDLGQAALRDAQLAALGQVDLLLVPVGDGPTIGAAQAMAIVEQVRAKIVVPAHYRTERIDFLEPLDGFAERFATVHRADAPAVDLDALTGRRRAAAGAPGRAVAAGYASAGTPGGRANRAGWPVDSRTDSHRSPSGSTVLRRLIGDRDRDVHEAAVPAADDHLGAPGHRGVDGGVGEPDAVDAVVRVGRARCGSRSSGRAA